MRLVHDASCSDSVNTDSMRVQAKICTFREIVMDRDCPMADNSYAAVSCRKLPYQQITMVQVWLSTSR